MYLLAKLHPDQVKIAGDRLQRVWLNEQEKRQQIDRFYAEKLHIPLNFAHEGADDRGFVSREQRGGKGHAGRVLDIFNDKHGDLIVKCLVDNQHPLYRQISQGMRRERWGVSVWINVFYPNGVGTEPAVKQIVHVALTPDPAMAAQDTFFTKWALNEKYMDNEIHRAYFSEAEERCYFGGPLREKMLSRVKGI